MTKDTTKKNGGPLEHALQAFGLRPEHVLASRLDTQTGEVIILTQGGQRLRWPRDEGRVLAQHEKDGTVPGSVPEAPKAASEPDDGQPVRRQGVCPDCFKPIGRAHRCES